MKEVKETDRAENEQLLKEMCEVIQKSGILTNEDGTKPSADEIFEHSLVAMIHLYYALALDELGIAKLDIKQLK
jgi:hypothetical protein